MNTQRVMSWDERCSMIVVQPGGSTPRRDGPLRSDRWWISSASPVAAFSVTDNGNVIGG